MTRYRQNTTMSFHTYVTAINHDNQMLAARIAATGFFEERIVLIGDKANGRIAFPISLGIEDQGILLAIITTRTPVDRHHSWCSWRRRRDPGQRGMTQTKTEQRYDCSVSLNDRDFQLRCQSKRGGHGPPLENVLIFIACATADRCLKPCRSAARRLPARPRRSATLSSAPIRAPPCCPAYAGS